MTGVRRDRRELLHRPEETSPSKCQRPPVPAPYIGEVSQHEIIVAQHEVIEELLTALEAVRPLMIPGMDWTDEVGELVKTMVRDAIAKATGSAA